PPPPGKHVMPALDGGPSALEAELLGALDPDRVNQLAEGLFTLNSRRFGPIPGAYVVLCIEAGRRWCVGQLSADRARPLRLFDDMQFTSPTAAQDAAEALRRERGEPVPQRSI
ncbi:MAG: hypothetical protein WD928_09070, partial [Gammaproteobacteria bacterium]